MTRKWPNIATIVSIWEPFFPPKLFESEFVETLTLLNCEKVDIIGTRFSTIPGDFEQGLQEIILKKLIQNGQKRLNVDTLITLINVQLKLEKIQLSLPGSKN